MSDLVRAIAFAFRRKAQERMPRRDVIHTLAFDLRWLAPEDAKRAVQRALETGLLVEEGDAVHPSFDHQAVEVPVNFRPGAALMDEPVPADLPPRRPAGAPAAEPATAPPPPRPPEMEDDAEPLAREERAKRGNLLGIDVARLVIARRAGEDVRERASQLAQRMLKA